MGLLGITAAEALEQGWSPGRIGADGVGWLIAQGPAALGTAVLGMGASVIIYLVIEELLREAHEVDTGPIEVAVMFACFLPFFLAGIAVG